MYRIYLLMLIMLFAFNSCKEQCNEIEFQSDKLLIIPISVNGEKIDFVFDTGSTHSFISEDLAQQLGIIKGAEAEVDAFAMKTKLKCFKSQRKTDIKIGNYSFHEHIYIRPPFDEWKSKAVLGMDIIEQLHWSFDFRNNILIVADQEISDNKSNGNTLILPYNSPKSFVEIPLLDSSKHTFVMDTGFSDTYDPSVNDVLPDFIMYNFNADSICRVLRSEKVQSFFVNLNEWNFIMSDSLRVKSKNIIYPCIGVHSDPYYNSYPERYRSIITLRFITRFSKFAINPVSKHFTFFLSDDDSSRNKSDANRTLFNWIKEQIDKKTAL